MASTGPCNRCSGTQFPCAFFEEHIDDVCLCSHSRAAHPLRRVLAARGGMDERSCQQFRAVGGASITDFRQLCQCGGPYSAHQRLQAQISVAESLIPPTHLAPPLSQPRSGAPERVMGQLLPLSSQLEMPPITLYQPRPSQSSNVFGVTQAHQPRNMSAASSSAPSRQPTARRGRGGYYNPIAANGRPALDDQQRHRNLSITILLSILPRDLKYELAKQDYDGIHLPYWNAIHPGERIAQDLRFLQSEKLASVVTLTAKHGKECCLAQISAHFDKMIHNAPYEYPSSSSTQLVLDNDDVANRDARIKLSGLPFRILKIGNPSNHNGLSLTLDKGLNISSFSYKSLIKRFRRDVAKHPTDPENIQGLIFVCTKGRRPILGPIGLDRTLHHCFSDYIIIGLQKSAYDKGDAASSEDDPPEERERQWKEAFPLLCWPECPRPPATPSHQQFDDADYHLEDDDDDHDILNTDTVGIRRSSRLIAAGTSMPGPSAAQQATPIPSTSILHNVHPVFAATPMHPAAPTLTEPIITIPSTSAAVPLTRSSGSYQRTDGVCFSNFKEFTTQHLSTSRILSVHDNDVAETSDVFRIEATSVAHAAEGLRVAIIGVARDTNASLNPQKNGVALAKFLPREISLGRLFSYAIWVCQAGREDDIDTVGNGVLRQVLDEALQQCLTFEEGLVEELGNGDGYFSLKISADGIVGPEKLDKFFALGALCTIFMIQTHNGPEPISPALIQAAIGGIDSILEPSWIQAISPPVAEILSLIPMDPAQAIPNQPKIRHFIEARLPGTQFEAVQSSTQRPNILRKLCVNALLGSSELVLVNSSEFKAFAAGLDFYLTPLLPSFISSISSSSKYMLSQAYCRRIHSAEQVIAMLHYQFLPKDVSTLDKETVLHDIQHCFERYLQGTGHPFPQQYSGLLSSETMEAEMHDPTLRAKRFVKVTSGLTMVPAVRQHFEICVREKIDNQAVLFNEIYDPVNDLIPPVPHACTYTLDIYINNALLAAIAAAKSAPLGVDTDFDYAMHTGIAKMGDDEFNA